MMHILAKNKFNKNLICTDDDGFWMQKESNILFFYGGEEKISEKNKELILAQIAGSKTSIVLWMKKGVLSEVEEAVIFSALQKASERVSVFYITDGLVYDAVQKGAVRYITLADHGSVGAADVYKQLRYLSISMKEDGKLSYYFKKVWE